MRKSERVFTFLAPKNQLPSFFLCAKYGPKVNTISIEYDKKVQQCSFSRHKVSLFLKIENF